MAVRAVPFVGPVTAVAGPDVGTAVRIGTAVQRLHERAQDRSRMAVVRPFGKDRVVTVPAIVGLAAIGARIAPAVAWIVRQWNRLQVDLERGSVEWRAGPRREESDF